MNDKSSDKQQATPSPYKAVNDNLPRTMFPATPTTPQTVKSDQPKRNMVDAKYAVRKQAFELGLNIDDQQAKLCSVILFGVWQDEQQNATKPVDQEQNQSGGKEDGERKANVSSR